MMMIGPLQQSLAEEEAMAKFVADKIEHADQPFAGPLLHAVQRIAGGGLLYLPEEKGFVRDEKLEKVRRR